MSCFSSEEEKLQRKIVIVGDGACGKTCLLGVFCNGNFPMTQYIPTIFETAAKDIQVNSRNVTIELWDTAGQEDYDRLRTLSYPDSDAIIVTFSIDLLESLENITEKWIPEVQRYCAGLPIILVACKADLRQNEEPEKLISYQQGLDAAKKVGAYKYVECSAKLGQGVQQVFEVAVESTMITTTSCVIM